MIIKRYKDYYVYVGAYILACLVYTLILCDLGFYLGILLLALVPMYWLTVSNIIANGRTFVFDEDGCTVCFFKYRKKYAWNELKTKRIESHTMYSMFSGTASPPYLREVIFAPYIIHKPKVIRAEFYSMLHPFRCIYIHFDPKVESYSSSRHYEIDETVFRTKMDEWGVDLIDR